MTASTPSETPGGTGTGTAPTLSPEQLAEVLPLLRGSDSVELKVTVPNADRRSVIGRLGLDVMRAEIRQVVFFDTPDLRLDAQGLVLRARRIQRKPGDSVIKVRPAVPSELSESLRRSRGFGVEVDALPGGFVCSARMKAPVQDKRLRQVFAGAKPIRKAFTQSQRAMFDDRAAGEVGLDDLAVLGPINIMKLKFSPAGFSRGMVAELWFYPDGAQVLELSTKCLPDEAFSVAAEAREFLASRGVDLGAPQATKTKTALAYFASLDDAS